MIGLDTNVLVRLITDDDPKQAARAQKAIARQCSEDDPGFVNSVVLTETVWVLFKVYGYSKEQIVTAVEAILQVKELTVQNASEAWEALHFYRDGNVGFADLYIAAINRDRDCDTTLTFDKKAAKTGWFELL